MCKLSLSSTLVHYLLFYGCLRVRRRIFAKKPAGLSQISPQVSSRWHSYSHLLISYHIFPSSGTSAQIQAVINAGVFPKLISLLQSSEFDIQKEAAWAVSNATSGGEMHSLFILKPAILREVKLLLRYFIPRDSGADHVSGAARSDPTFVRSSVAS